MIWCNVGVGEEYIRRQAEDDLDESAGSSCSATIAVENALAEYTNMMMSVVMFFLKKGFRHVR